MIEPPTTDHSSRSPTLVPIVSPADRGLKTRAAKHVTDDDDHGCPPRRQRAAPWAGEVASLRLVIIALRKELRAAEDRAKQARHLAYHDDLTALPNRRYFLKHLEAALAGKNARSFNLAVIYLDLDGFKALNDAHGHDAGDQLLKIVAARLTHALRAEDLVSRLGGDEYACLIAGVLHRERLQEIASALFDAVSTPFKLGPLMLKAQPSIGIAVYPFDGITSGALMKSADAAMYASKRKQSRTSFAERPRLLSPCDASQ